MLYGCVKRVATGQWRAPDALSGWPRCRWGVVPHGCLCLAAWQGTRVAVSILGEALKLEAGLLRWTPAGLWPPGHYRLPGDGSSGSGWELLAWAAPEVGQGIEKAGGRGVKTVESVCLIFPWCGCILLSGKPPLRSRWQKNQVYWDASGRKLTGFTCRKSWR